MTTRLSRLLRQVFLCLFAGSLCLASTTRAWDPAAAAAVRAIEERDYARAHELLGPLVAEENPEALYLLGEMKQRGLGTQASIYEAALLFRRAADQKNGDAMLSLSLLLRTAMAKRAQSAAGKATWLELEGLGDPHELERAALRMGTPRALLMQCKAGSDTLAPLYLRRNGISWCLLLDELPNSMSAQQRTLAASLLAKILRDTETAELEEARRLSALHRDELVKAGILASLAIPRMANVPPDVPLLPLAVGNQWTYRIKGEESGTRTHRVTRTSRVEDRDWYLLNEGEPKSAPLWYSPRELDIYEGWDLSDSPEGRAPGEDTRLLLFMYPPPKSKEYATPMYDIKVDWLDESVSVPAGTFRCLRYSLTSTPEYTTHYDFAPGRGIVRYQRVENGKVIELGELLDYQLNNRTFPAKSR